MTADSHGFRCYPGRRAPTRHSRSWEAVLSRSVKARILLTAFFAVVLIIGGQGTAGAAGLSLSGPAQVTTTGNYTYYADLHAFYQSYYWYTRYCPTTSLSTCLSTWSLSRNAYKEVGYDTYTRYLTRDCTGGGTKSFQVKVTASGFNTPAETRQMVTRLCPDLK